MQKIGTFQDTWWKGQLPDIWHCTASLFLLSFWSVLRADNVVLTTNHNVGEALEYKLFEGSKDSIQGSLGKHKTMEKMKKQLTFVFP